MLRQPMQRFTQMQASDIDIYRNETRKTKNEIVRPRALSKPMPCRSELLARERASVRRNRAAVCAHWPVWHACEAHALACVSAVLLCVSSPAILRLPLRLPQDARLQVYLLSKHTGKEKDEIERTIVRPRYFNPYEAVDFGIIDRVRPLVCPPCVPVAAAQWTGRHAVMWPRVGQACLPAGPSALHAVCAFDQVVC